MREKFEEERRQMLETDSEQWVRVLLLLLTLTLPLPLPLPLPLTRCACYSSHYP